MKNKIISIIIPAYNEEKTIKDLVKKVLAVEIPNITKEIIIVNDGSTDKTKAVLHKLRNNKVRVIDKKYNEGKGAAIRAGLRQVTGDIIVIQDADLEYNPDEYKLLVQPILDNKADVVYGSRFVTTEARRVLYFWHSLGNNLLTTFSNMLTNLNLSDMETCYKMFTKEVADKLTITENRFGFEPEFTAKVAKMGCRIYEVGISYSGRNYAEGKKINWRDGAWAVWCVLKYNLLI